MEILGVGPLEFIFILLIAFIVIGPKDVAKTGRTIGYFLRKIVTSQWWSGFRQASREISQLPYTLMREANIEEVTTSLKEIESFENNIAPVGSPNDKPDFQSWVNPTFPTSDFQDNSRSNKPGTHSENSNNPSRSG